MDNITNTLKNLLPQYECFLPFANKKVFYTPFRVKDAKNISIILQENNKNLILNSLYDILTSNTKDVNIDDLCLADAEYLFLNIRSKSIDEQISVKINGVSTKINIPDIKFRNKPIDENIVLDSGAVLRIKSPTLKDLKNCDFNDSQAILKKSIESITIHNEIYHLNKFLNNQAQQIIDNLPLSFLSEMKKISKKEPELYVTIQSEEGESEVSGILNFFTYQ
jgi:hypothetical protein